MKVTQGGTTYYIPLSQNSAVNYIDGESIDNQYVTGRLVVNSHDDGKGLYISRSGNINNERARHYVVDTGYVIDYTNDEVSSSVVFNIENTDTESGGGVSANSGQIRFNQGTSGTAITINGSKVLTEADGGGGGGIDATTLTGLSSSQFLRSDIDDTINGVVSFSNKSIWGKFLGKTDADSKIVFGEYVGGTAYWNIEYKGSTSGNSGNHFQIRSQGTNNGIRINHEGLFERINGANSYTIWDSGNDGIGSGLDAELLGGVSYLNYLRSDADGTISNPLIVNDNLTAKYITVQSKTDYNHAQKGIIEYDHTNTNSVIDGVVRNGSVYIGHAENGTNSAPDYDNMILYTGDLNARGVYTRGAVSFIESSITKAKIQYDDDTESMDFIF